MSEEIQEAKDNEIDDIEYHKIMEQCCFPGDIERILWYRRHGVKIE